MSNAEESVAADGLRALVARRGKIKGQITRFTSFLSRANSAVPELQDRLEKIECVWTEFDDVQTKIEFIDDSEKQEEHRAEFEDTYFEVVSRAKGILADAATLHNSRMQCSSGNSAFNAVHSSGVQLPSINLPKFDGRYDKWMAFKDAFDALIDKNKTLANVQKFFYLKLSVTGVASEVIADLEATDSNYNVAWKLLQDRFENRKLICHTHVRAIFELPTISKEASSNLQRLVDDFQKNIRALNNLGEPTDQWSTLLVYLVSSKLDINTQKEWNRESSKLTQPTIKELMQFLTERCHFLESIESNRKISVRPQEKTLAHFSQNLSCFLCKGAHYLYTCKKFLDLSEKSRYNEAAKLGLCINCLRKGHKLSDCKSSGCRKCNKKHNSLLHFEKTENSNTYVANGTTEQASLNMLSSVAPSSRLQGATTESVSIAMHSESRQVGKEPYVLLSTAIVNVIGNSGNFENARVILDAGSQSNFMTRELCSRLNLPVRKVDIKVIGLNSATSNACLRTTATIKSSTSNFSVKLSFLVVNKITECIPTVSFDASKLEIPESVTLADPTFNVSNQIDVLIGAEIYHDLLEIGRIKLGTGKPTLVKSRLGWILSGPILFHDPKQTRHCNLSSNQAVQNILEQFWHIEDVEIPSVRKESECERIFRETLNTNESGRYVVQLPMVNSGLRLGNSLDTAISRFYALERKLNRDPELHRRYHGFMTEYQSLGHMSELTESQIGDQIEQMIFYMPHHGVLKEDSITTKLRVVFDASAKSGNGVSLNNVLLAGPCIQEDIFSILLRFRKHNFVMIADIEKMYRMIEVCESQKDLQRIVWRFNSSQPISHYRLNTLTYGTSPASFIATRCLHECAFEKRESFPESAEVVLSDFYVDDLITGANTVHESITLKHEISSMLSAHGFNLRKWASNDMSILESDREENQGSEHFIAKDASHKTLGVQWQSDSDTLHYKINLKCNKNVNKRTILSTIAQIFDPMGLVGPVSIKAKIILQEL